MSDGLSLLANAVSVMTAPLMGLGFQWGAPEYRQQRLKVCSIDGLKSLWIDPRHSRCPKGGYRRLALMAERGCFDALFLSDTLAMLPGSHQTLSRMSRTEHFEPLTLLGALAAVTRRIGLVATVTTSPLPAVSLPWRPLSGVRSGWSLVGSSNAEEAFNFGRQEHFEHAQHYVLAREFLAQVRVLD